MDDTGNANAGCVGIVYGYGRITGSAVTGEAHKRVGFPRERRTRLIGYGHVRAVLTQLQTAVSGCCLAG